MTPTPCITSNPSSSSTKVDPESVFNTWFVNNDERLKAFRSIRRGVLQVVTDIRDGRFPNDFKGSSLEFVLTCITEQKQVFEGASHPFYWKPKLRIPDIYEHAENKRAFGQFLENCLNAKSEKYCSTKSSGSMPGESKGWGGRRFDFVFPAPDADAAVQYGHFKWFQHAFSRKTQTRFVVGVSENAGSGARN